MAEIYPQPAGFTFDLAGPVYAMIAEDQAVARIDAILTASVEIDDVLTITGSVLAFDGADIDIYHGNALVGTLYNNLGAFGFVHTATNTSTLLRFQSGGGELRAFHQLGGISVDKSA